MSPTSPLMNVLELLCEEALLDFNGNLPTPKTVSFPPWNDVSIDVSSPEVPGEIARKYVIWGLSQSVVDWMSHPPRFTAYYLLWNQRPVGVITYTPNQTPRIVNPQSSKNTANSSTPVNSTQGPPSNARISIEPSYPRDPAYLSLRVVFTPIFPMISSLAEFTPQTRLPGECVADIPEVDSIYILEPYAHRRAAFYQEAAIKATLLFGKWIEAQGRFEEAYAKILVNGRATGKASIKRKTALGSITSVAAGNQSDGDTSIEII